MSRRSVRWAREVAKAGGDLDKILPRKARGEGRTRVNVCKVNEEGFWYVEKYGTHGYPSLADCSKPMTRENEARVRARFNPKGATARAA